MCDFTLKFNLSSLLVASLFESVINSVFAVVFSVVFSVLGGSGRSVSRYTLSSSNIEGPDRGEKGIEGKERRE